MYAEPISPAPNTDPHSASYTPIIRLTPVMQQRNVLGNFTAEELSELHSTSGDTPSYGN